MLSTLVKLTKFLPRTMKVAVEGCCHGELDAIYRSIARLEEQLKAKVDLLLICGDFQAIRNHQDLQCMSVPQKYKKLGEFHKYYTGQKIAPILTIVIGGNHEASNYLWELYHGGWLAPNIYYLGHSGCVNVNGLRIAGASGIFKPQDYHQGHWETLPYTPSSMRSSYHIRDYDVHRLSLLTRPTVFLSHDWPKSIEQHGDLNDLLRRKPFFKNDIRNGQLGSPPLMALLQTLKPEWWFSAHLHVKFEATVFHGDRSADATALLSSPPRTPLNPDEITVDDEDNETVMIRDAPRRSRLNPDETSVDDEEHDTVLALLSEGAQKYNETTANERVSVDGEAIDGSSTDDTALDPSQDHPPFSGNTSIQSTKFLALDKCLPGRKFLEIVDIATLDHGNTGEVNMTYDPEWLAITRALHPFLSTQRVQPRLPDETQVREMVRRELKWVNEHIGSGKLVTDVQQFTPTAPGPGAEGPNMTRQPPWYTNPQTEVFCAMLGLTNKVNPPPSNFVAHRGESEPPATPPTSEV